MIVSIEPSLTERIVFDAARRDPNLSARYHGEFAACYPTGTAEDCSRAFQAMHERWFDELGLRARLMRPIEQFPFIASSVQRCAVADAHGRRASVELFGRPGHYTIAMAILPATLLNEVEFVPWVRHELQHVEDMLDPAFGYDREARLTGRTVAAENLARDRYAVLWATSIDARLSADGRADADVREKWRRQFDRVFAGPDEAATMAAFDAFWSASLTGRIDHRAMLDLAMSDAHGAGIGPATAVRPGTPCPLCCFPTYDWAASADLSPDVLRLLRTDHPTWTIQAGLCGRCAELLRSRAATASPTPAACSR